MSLSRKSMPLPFVIVADLRTGSTLLSTSLDRHPDIRCRGELLHGDDFPDNQLAGVRRQELPARRLIDLALTERGRGAAGFRAMVEHPDQAAPKAWQDAWRVLRERKNLHVIFLERLDLLAQFASYCVAQQTGHFAPSAHDPVLAPENRPRIRIEPDAVQRWSAQRRRLYALRRRQLQGKPQLDLTYEGLVNDWDNQILRLQEFVGVTPRPLQQAKQKQERRPLSDVIANYSTLRRNTAP